MTSRKIILLLPLVLAIIIGGSALILVRNLSRSPAPESPAVKTPLPDSLYSNTELGFSILHPSEFEIVQVGWQPMRDNEKGYWILDLTKNTAKIIVDYRDTPTTAYGTRITRIEQTILGVDAEFFEFSGFPAARYSQMSTNKTFTRGMHILKGSSLWHVYTLVLSDNQRDRDEADIILSSFKFL